MSDATETENVIAARPYFARRSVRALVFGAFAFLTLPMALILVWLGPTVLDWVPFYFITIGFTHFLATGFIYLDARNLRYFNSSRANRLIYFAVPLLILVAVALAAATGLRARSPWLDAGLFQLVFLANLFHVSRQNFGVLQLFKSAAGALGPEGLRSVENLFFLGLALLQAETFWSGRVYDSESLGVRLTTSLVLGIFVLGAILHVKVLRERAGMPRSWTPLVYFVLQGAAGALAVWQTSLYAIALAMHYVEYHVVMMPRIFDAPVDSESVADRSRKWVATSKPVFYGGLVAVAWSIWFAQRTTLYLDPTEGSLAARMALHMLDGIFLVHFFVEAFVWKFSKPHYRDSLGPLYLAPREASGD